MGSIINYIQCPRCSQPNCYYDYSYKLKEETTFCQDCGFLKTKLLKRDGNGNFIKKDSTKNYGLDNFIQELVLIENPYCAFNINNRITGVLKTEEDYQGFVEQVLKSSEITSAVISRYVNGKIITENIK